MNIPTPGDLGFPEKFDKWRPSQVDALTKLLQSKKRVKALSAPTGFGKTAVVIAYALLTGQPTCVVTDNRALQDQYMDDFEGVGMVDIRGRSNYTCDLKDDYTCEMGYATRCPHKGQVSCASTFAEMRAASSSLVVTNYDKWTSAKKYGQGMSHFSQVVFDEGHKAPHALENAMQVVLHHKEIQETLGLEFLPPSEADEFTNWKLWAIEARAEAETHYNNWRIALQGDRSPKQSHVREMLHMRNLARRLAILSTAKPENWLADETEDGYQFDPIRVGQYGEGALLLRLPSILIVSATLKPKTLFMLGVKKDDFDFFEYQSEFDAARCPIYYIPTMRVDSRADSLAPLWLKHDQIASRRTDRKGIVHTISYARRDAILQASRFASSMLINERGQASTSAIAQFRQSPPGTILVSPSVGEGFDFPLKACEWQFICKLPFPHQTKIIKARSEDDKEYPYYITINTLQQIVGRGMRSKPDQCESFIVDEHLEWFLPRYGHLASRPFHKFFRKVDTVPAPPPRL